MAKVSAYHSTKGTVHHTCSTCTLGNNIEKENRKDGTGGLPKCSECSDREKDGRC